MVERADGTAHSRSTEPSSASSFFMFLVLVFLLIPRLPKPLDDGQALVGILAGMVGSALAWESEHRRWDGP